MNTSPDERKSALFAGLILQQSNMALMFLGKTPNPETGKPMRDLQSAQIFIDQLEMLDEKTRGNLTQEEGQMLKSTLTGLRMAFVEASNQPEPAESPDSSPAQAPPTQAPAADKQIDPAGTAENPPDSESRKKYSKKY